MELSKYINFGEYLIISELWFVYIECLKMLFLLFFFLVNGQYEQFILIKYIKKDDSCHASEHFKIMLTVATEKSICAVLEDGAMNE